MDLYFYNNWICLFTILSEFHFHNNWIIFVAQLHQAFHNNHIIDLSQHLQKTQRNSRNFTEKSKKFRLASIMLLVSSPQYNLMFLSLWRLLVAQFCKCGHIRGAVGRYAKADVLWADSYPRQTWSRSEAYFPQIHSHFLDFYLSGGICSWNINIRHRWWYFQCNIRF